MNPQQQVAALYANIGVKIGDAIRGLREFRSRLQQSQSGLKTLRDQAKITGAAVTAFLTAPIALLGKASIEMLGDYQKSMNVFQLITKASTEEMGLASAAINTLAHDLDLPQFTKLDAAHALEILARNGLSARDAIDALRPSLLLAAAGEVNAQEGAELMAAALNVWSLKAKDAGMVADMLAAAMKFGGVSFGDLRTAVQIAGAAFAQAKVPMDVFLTLIAELGKAGIKGSEAGTALRNMLQSLIAPSEEAGGLLRALGVKVYDAQGQMRPLRDILGELHDAFAKLTPAQQEQYAATIFGREQMGAALAIIKGGLPLYDDFHDKIQTAGIAQELAKTKAEGLSGATADLSREMQNASGAALEPFQKDLADLAHGAADALRWFQALPPEIRGIAGALILALPVLGTLELAWIAISTAVYGLISGLATLGGWLGIVLGPIGVAALAIGGLIGVVIYAWEYVGYLSDAFAALTGIRVDFGAIFQSVPILREIIGIWEQLKKWGLIPGGTPAGGVSGGTFGGGGSGGGSGGTPTRVVNVGGNQMVAGAAAGGGNQTNVNFYGQVFGFADVKDMIARAIDELRREGRVNA